MPPPLPMTGVASRCDSEAEGAQTERDLAGGDGHQDAAGEGAAGAPGVGRATLVAVLADRPLGAEVAKDDVGLGARREGWPRQAEGLGAAAHPLDQEAEVD